MDSIFSFCSMLDKISFWFLHYLIVSNLTLFFAHSCLSCQCCFLKQTEAVERWRREKLEVAKQLTFERGTLNSTIPHEEGGMVFAARGCFFSVWGCIHKLLFDWWLIWTVFFFFLAGMLVRALESDWALLSEEIGLWMAAEVINKEHDDKPEGEEELGNCSVQPHSPVCSSLISFS